MARDYTILNNYPDKVLHWVRMNTHRDCRYGSDLNIDDPDFFNFNSTISCSNCGLIVVEFGIACLAFNTRLQID